MTTQLPNSTDYYLSEEFEYLKNNIVDIPPDPKDDFAYLYLQTKIPNPINIGTTPQYADIIGSHSHTISSTGYLYITYFSNLSATFEIVNDKTKSYTLLFDVVFKSYSSTNTDIPVGIYIKDNITNTILTDWIVSYNINDTTESQIVGRYMFIDTINNNGARKEYVIMTKAANDNIAAILELEIGITCIKNVI